MKRSLASSRTVSRQCCTPIGFMCSSGDGSWSLAGTPTSWRTRASITRCGVSKLEKGEQSTPYRVETVRLSKSDPARDLNLLRSEERAGDPAETRAGHRRVRRAEARAVERVVEFSQQLEADTLANGHALLGRDIPFVDARSAKVGSAR